MKHLTGVALGVLALLAGSGVTAPVLADEAKGPAQAEAAQPADWQRKLELRLQQNANTIAADAMSAATRLDLAARLEQDRNDELQVLALATEI